MSKKTTLGLFLVLAVVQIAVPASMIAQHEIVLREGRLYKFKTAPVVPADAFRGRYVALSMAETMGPTDPDVHWETNQRAYAELTEDSQGFAHISRVTPKKPEGPDYIVVRIRYIEGPQVHVDLPIDRYYMNEYMAPEAEYAYMEHSRATVDDAYVTVRVLNGHAVIEGLYVADTRIEEFIKKKK
ncbi:MAG: GDYXXLXY domain-containing protein [FCB group bacterium]|jgi:uncharacterized membrane-anchored protein|nr:GDYXXLXY domain-containing protein [FCB group bacterium]